MPSQSKYCGLDALELKALSVPSALRFLLGIEYDVVLCVTEIGGRPFSLHFPLFSETFRKLLSLCATRFQLEYAEDDDDDGPVLRGTAVMPLLRYADYIPGALHMEELLECLNVAPVAKAKRRSHGKDAFDACFIDYSEFRTSTSLTDVHGLGFYLMQDYGLNLASHGHLLELRFHLDWDVKQALREFQEFSGWQEFDLRFYDEENKKMGGIVVFPSVQDVCDLLDKYEDEDSDDEGDLLPFILRPVCPLVAVPSIEDSTLRKLREQYWPEIVAFWERFPKTKNTVVIFSLYDGATTADILKFLEDVPIAEAHMVEDSSPAHRRRIFVKLTSTEGAKRALELDGRSTKGCTLRVHVSPPYFCEERRGRVVTESAPAPTAAAAPTAAPAKRTTPPPVAPATTEEKQKQQQQQQQQRPAHGAALPAAEDDVGKKLSEYFAASAHHFDSTKKTAAAPTDTHASAAPPHQLHPSADGKPDDHETSETASASLSANAKEFVPSFQLRATSPEFHPTAHYSPQGMDAMELPPPPSYAASVSPHLHFSNSPHLMGGNGAAPPPPPPAYDLPPAYETKRVAVGYKDSQLHPPPHPHFGHGGPTAPLHGAQPPPPPYRE